MTTWASPGGGGDDLSTISPPTRALTKSYEPFSEPIQGMGERQTNNARTCYDFGHSVQEGDLVFAKKGRRAIIAWGIVRGPYRYEVEKDLRHRREVEWKATGHWTLPAGINLGLKTLTEISNDVEQMQMLIDLAQTDGAASTIRSTDPATTPDSPPPSPYDLNRACLVV